MQGPNINVDELWCFLLKPPIKSKKQIKILTKILALYPSTHATHQLEKK
jgi:hypothetical protein